jgi:hypothetical protein
MIGRILIVLSTVEESNITSFKELYDNAPQLLDFYKQKLLEPGWAGELSPNEFTYIKSQLKQSPSLRRRWGFRPSARRLSESRIRDIARNGLSANEKPVLASAAVEERVRKY